MGAVLGICSAAQVSVIVQDIDGFDEFQAET